MLSLDQTFYESLYLLSNIVIILSLFYSSESNDVKRIWYISSVLRYLLPYDFCHIY